MDNVRFFISELDGTEWAEIDRGNGELTSMPKSVWEELQAAKEAQSL